jgi:hypothetical protein
MSSSSTTTSDPCRSPKPLDSRVDPGGFALLGRLDRAGFRRDSAANPLKTPPDADQGTSAYGQSTRYAPSESGVAGEPSAHQDYLQ